MIDESVAPLFRGVRLGEMAVIAGLAGLGEEMLFRGVIQRALAGWIGGPSGLWIALGVTAVLFGLGHAITRMYFAIAALWASTLAACCWQPTICWFPSQPMPSMTS